MTINHIGLDNGLVPIRQKAIIWTNADPIDCRDWDSFIAVK